MQEEKPDFQREGKREEEEERKKKKEGGEEKQMVAQEPPANTQDAGNVDSIPGSGGFPEGGNGDPLQCSCLENSMGKGAWWATAHMGVQRGHD